MEMVLSSLMVGVRWRRPVRRLIDLGRVEVVGEGLEHVPSRVGDGEEVGHRKPLQRRQYRRHGERLLDGGAIAAEGYGVEAGDVWQEDALGLPGG